MERGEWVAHMVRTNETAYIVVSHEGFIFSEKPCLGYISFDAEPDPGSVLQKIGPMRSLTNNLHTFVFSSLC